MQGSQKQWPSNGELNTMITINSLTKDIEAWLAVYNRQVKPENCPIRKLHEAGIPMYLCGGAVREIAITGPTAYPRDIDLMVDCQYQYLEQEFKKWQTGKTYFGGIILNTPDRKQFDIWEASRTTKFEDRGYSEAKDFTKIVPLSTEAAVVKITPDSVLEITERGFIDSINNAEIRMNDQWEVDDGITMLRTLHLAWQHKFTIGNKLAVTLAEQIYDGTYCVRQSGDTDISNALMLYRDRYSGVFRMNDTAFIRNAVALLDWYKHDGLGPFELPVYHKP